MVTLKFENNEFRDAVIVGDGGYACHNYLMTPIIIEAEVPYQV